MVEAYVGLVLISMGVIAALALLYMVWIVLVEDDDGTDKRD